MGYQKVKRPLLAPRFKSFAAGSTAQPAFEAKQKATISVTSTATILPETGTVSLNFATDKTARLATPVAGGRVTVTAVKSTAINAVTTKTTAQTFFGSTFQTLTFSTTLTYRSATFEVVGSSTSLKWSLVAKSTGATLA